MVLFKLFSKTKKLFLTLESNLFSYLFENQFPQAICPVGIDRAHRQNNDVSNSFLESLKSPFLYAVPKTRRTVEKRRNRKFGWPQYHWKPLVAKTNILLCDTCGHDYEAGHLCANCYNQVKIETEEMQKRIEAELKLDPVDKEVVVLYEGEAEGKPAHFWKDKRIVEMKKTRPSWFSNNLLQKSTSDSTDDKNIKPKDLA